MSDPNSLSAEPLTPERIQAAANHLREWINAEPPVPIDWEGEYRRSTIERMARNLPLDQRDNLIAGAATVGIGREVIDAQPPPPPWFSLPPPIQRQGEAIEKRRQKRRAHAKMRQRRRGDRAGRPT